MKLKAYAVSFVVAFAVGGLGAVVTYLGMDAFNSVVQPALSPPSWLFPVVWTILFALMAIGAARVFLADSENSHTALIIYACQLAANFLWCVFFFGLGAYLFSFLWLLLLIAAVVLTAVSFYRVDKLAGIIQIPYILWLCFAAYLNLGVYMLN